MSTILFDIVTDGHRVVLTEYINGWGLELRGPVASCFSHFNKYDKAIQELVHHVSVDELIEA